MHMLKGVETVEKRRKLYRYVLIWKLARVVPRLS